MSNKMGSKPICDICKFSTKKTIDDHNINFISLKKFSQLKNSFSFSYSNSDELREIKYREVSIGLSILSSYMSLTRNMSPKIEKESKDFFDQHLIQNINFIDALYKLIEDIKPEVVYSYNGRYEEVRPIYDICKHLRINFTFLEVVKRNGKWYKTGFENSLPHDINENLKKRDYCWNNYKLSEEQKISLGKSFFDKRRNGEFSGDRKIYVANQKEGYIPEFKPNKINIAIMNSSEDEFAAIGEEWDNLKLFKTQLEGIVYLLDNAEDGIHFYLRIHPNLKNVHYKYHLKLEELEYKYNNITIIPASSEMSTYTLMEKVDKVISFGSTMGLESVYWGKPSILVGPSLYYFDDVSFVPSSKIDLIKLLSQNLKANRENIKILKMGAYILNKDPLIIDLERQFKYVDFNVERHRILGKELSVAPFINFIVNKTITGFILAFLRGVFDNKYFRKYKLPTVEE